MLCSAYFSVKCVQFLFGDNRSYVFYCVASAAHFLLLQEEIFMSESEITKEIAEKFLSDFKANQKTNQKDGTENQKWENTFIFRQINEQKKDHNTPQEHMRAAVYSIISGGAKWNKYLDNIGQEEKTITNVEECFGHFSDMETVRKILDEKPNSHFQKYIEGWRFFKRNIEELKLFADSLDADVNNRYKEINNDDKTYFTLVNALSDPNSRYKVKGFGIPLACEYLRNLGYDIPKPDSHICDILFDCSFIPSRSAQEEAYYVMLDLAKVLDCSPAKLDYYLWSSCAFGYLQEELL